MSAQPDTHDMVVVHRVFRREFRLLPDLVGQVAEGNTARSAVLAEHLTDLVAALHHHHLNEDELLWPPLLQRATLHTELVHRMKSQHEALSAVLDRIEQVLPTWAATAGKADGAELAAALRDVSSLLELHLGEEEQEVLPLAREHLSLEEWAEIGNRGASSIETKRKRLLFLGMILEDASEQERQSFLAKLPAPVRALWKLVGRRSYDGYVRVIRKG
ncbi:hemerythrin domain-containing protein [Kribbella catacumbae]|uniref:hemerythrin domain-containing protein n=1 Tax=Kribbella catacumbae TaxID=460086 RepID=UPI00037BB150|nr:hemerythrin domain-containing protein [Kribbella catacumbae]